MAEKPKTIPEYIDSKPGEVRELLNDMYTLLEAIAPEAEQGIKWGMPAFTQEKILFTFAAFKNHIGLFPTPAVIVQFSDELSSYTTTKASIHFPLDKPLPKTLIKKIARYRKKEVLENGARWM